MRSVLPGRGSATRADWHRQNDPLLHWVSGISPDQVGNPDVLDPDSRELWYRGDPHLPRKPMKKGHKEALMSNEPKRRPSRFLSVGIAVAALSATIGIAACGGSR